MNKHDLRVRQAIGLMFNFEWTNATLFHGLYQRLDSFWENTEMQAEGPLEGARVYEVGPGPGGLTRALLRAGAKVVAVERDRRCLAPLAELAEAAAGRLTVIEGDALDAAMPAGAHVVANLPYNVGTALLVRWLGGEAWPPAWKSLTLMFQREVAERIVAAPGTGAYGRLAVLAAHPEARVELTIPRMSGGAPSGSDRASI